MSRRRPKLEPISVEDLLNAPGMSGFVSFLNVKPWENKGEDPETATGISAPPGTVEHAPLATVGIGDGTDPHSTDSQMDVFTIQAPMSTVDSDPLTTAHSGSESELLPPGDIAPSTTVDSQALPTVVDEAVPTVGGASSIIIAINPPPAVSGGFASRKFAQRSVTAPQYRRRWVSDQGQILSDKQVRPFRMAQEVLNSNERTLYNVLWNFKGSLSTDDQNVRLVRAGYETLSSHTNLAKKTIQRLIPRLIEKNFIDISEPPNFYTRTPALYKVFSYRKVLEIAAEQGRTHIAKLGHGVCFAKPLSTVPDNPVTTVPIVSLTTGLSNAPSTVVREPVNTVDRKSSKTVTDDPPPTVVGKSAHIDKQSISQGTSPSAEFAREMENRDPSIDYEAIDRIWRVAHEDIPDVTAEEILHFFDLRARAVYRTRGINNPIGVMLYGIKSWITPRKVQELREEKRQAEEETERYLREINGLRT